MICSHCAKFRGQKLAVCAMSLNLTSVAGEIHVVSFVNMTNILSHVHPFVSQYPGESITSNGTGANQPEEMPANPVVISSFVICMPHPGPRIRVRSFYEICMIRLRQRLWGCKWWRLGDLRFESQPQPFCHLAIWPRHHYSDYLACLDNMVQQTKKDDIGWHSLNATSIQLLNHISRWQSCMSYHNW